MQRSVLLTIIMACAFVAQAQFVTVKPYVATLPVDSAVCVAGNDTITAPTGGVSGFDSASVNGKYVWGVGIPYGATAHYLSGTKITLSAAPTIGSAGRVIWFDMFHNTSYGTGEWMGQIFRVYSYPGVGSPRTLVSVVLKDQEDILGNTDLVLLKAWSDTLGIDSATVVMPAAQALKVIGSISLSTATDYGGGRTLEAKNIQLECPGDVLYARLIAKATMVPTTTTPFLLEFGFK